MATVADVNTIQGLLDSALESEEWTVALRYAMRLQAAMAAVGEYEQEGVSFRYTPQSLSELIGRLQQNSAASTTVGIQRANMKFVAPDCD